MKYLTFRKDRKFWYTTLWERKAYRPPVTDRYCSSWLIMIAVIFRVKWELGWFGIGVKPLKLQSSYWYVAFTKKKYYRSQLQVIQARTRFEGVLKCFDTCRQLDKKEKVDDCQN